MNAIPPVDTERAELLAELARLRPEWRLGQTLANPAAAGRLDAGGVWDIEDAEALAPARELIAQFARDPAPVG